MCADRGVEVRMELSISTALPDTSRSGSRHRSINPVSAGDRDVRCPPAQTVDAAAPPDPELAKDPPMQSFKARGCWPSSRWQSAAEAPCTIVRLGGERGVATADCAVRVALADID